MPVAGRNAFACPLALPVFARRTTSLKRRTRFDYLAKKEEIVMRLGKAHTSALAIAIAQVGAFAQGASPCPRFPVGSSITAPQDLLSQNGVLQVTFTYQTTVDQNGNTLYCFTTASGVESPTLYVQPGG